MSYTVKTQTFEGPFDLLLSLVARQKVDVRELTIAEIADQYLAHLQEMQDLDLEVASDFLLVAATLLELKALSLLPRETAPEIGPDEDLSPDEARELLVARLLAYKQFKNAAAELAARFEAESRMHPRAAALEEPFLGLMPDYLEGVTLHTLAVTCADLLHRREVFLLEAEHVAAAPIPVETHVEAIRRILAKRKRTTFREVVPGSARPAEVVVAFLAILELYKRDEVRLIQDEIFGEIVIESVKKGLFS
ncbi:segregation/condensation protein A [Coriobacteriia bacterium Es71-Z0120]|jgi:segregation and condensation protein A|uniref:segregation and condensation protein A n=1 Tax=Parvivirga hydrogeniphila TaxID=2939460 RepID=UPI002260A7F9|nr:segregation/condensation protein A [Parvivirga hydrogeniphila]MCL4079044.1 segregation/condensation protein A [Parvivirga hydrogeniphila]